MEPRVSSPLYRCICRRRRETNPLFRAVLSDDLKELKDLIDAGNSVNIQNTKGSSLLNFVMRRKRVEIFDYLLSLEETDVNFLDRLEQSPLLYLAGVCFDDYFARRLIEKGANIHLTDDSGFTFLHLAAKSESDDTLPVAQLIIEKGADIDQQEHYGVTPLYAACEAGKFDWVCMLLYYGADVTIATKRGVLPLSIVSQDIPEDQQLQLQEMLFNYTFDNDKIILRLPTLVAAMTLNSNLFPKIIDNLSDVDYDLFDLQYMVTSLIHVKPKHLKLFMKKFCYIVCEMIDNFPPLDVLIRVASDLGLQGLKEIIDIFLNSDCAPDFVQSSVPANRTITHLIEIFSGEEQPMDKEDFTKMICIMLSYGLTVTSTDLDSVYHYFGRCELFQILLHMDVIMKSGYHDSLSMAVLYYDPFATIDSFLEDVSTCSFLLDYYDSFKLKEFVIANSSENEDLEKVKRLPQVPLLVELSRNAARRFIVDKFKVKNSVQFYTVLQWLPIGDMTRAIVGLDKKLY